MTTHRIWPAEPSRPDRPADPAIIPEQSGPLTLDQKIINVLKQVYDPEIPVNIVDLGLIYEIHAAPSPMTQGSFDVQIKMTLTTPNCPEAESIPDRVRQMVVKIAEVATAEVDIVWQPPWDKSMMSDDARLILGLE